MEENYNRTMGPLQKYSAPTRTVAKLNQNMGPYIWLVEIVLVISNSLCSCSSYNLRLSAKT